MTLYTSTDCPVQATKSSELSFKACGFKRLHLHGRARRRCQTSPQVCCAWWLVMNHSPNVCSLKIYANMAGPAAGAGRSPHGWR